MSLFSVPNGRTFMQLNMTIVRFCTFSTRYDQYHPRYSFNWPLVPVYNHVGERGRGNKIVVIIWNNKYFIIYLINVWTRWNRLVIFGARYHRLTWECRVLHDPPHALCLCLCWKKWLLLAAYRLAPTNFIVILNVFTLISWTNNCSSYEWHVDTIRNKCVAL